MRAPVARRRVRRSDHSWIGLLSLLAGILILLLLLVFFSAQRPVTTRLNAFRTSPHGCAARGSSFEYEAPFCFPSTEKGCVARGGFWGNLDAHTDGCNVVMPDAGQRCRDSSDCQGGRCLALLETTVVQQLAESGGEPVAADGLCAGLARVRGCNAELSDGRITRVQCQR